MLKYAIIFVVISFVAVALAFGVSIVATALGYGGVAAVIGKLLFGFLMVLAMIFVVLAALGIGAAK
jgi:uncharacterized membrane protein YtjA (UPF0391 family)